MADGSEAKSVRFGRDQWDFIAEVAQREGVSASQFIREGAFARAILYASRQNPRVLEEYEGLLEAARAFEAQLRPHVGPRSADGDGSGQDPGPGRT